MEHETEADQRLPEPPAGGTGPTAGAEPAASTREAAAPPGEPSAGTSSTQVQERGPLLPSEDLGGFRTRWEEIQVRFVDEPRGAVQQADALVEELARRLTDSFARERGELESRWDRGDEVSTEDLRVALQRYRSFFDRLLAA